MNLNELSMTSSLSRLLLEKKTKIAFSRSSANSTDCGTASSRREALEMVNSSETKNLRRSDSF